MFFCFAWKMTLAGSIVGKTAEKLRISGMFPGSPPQNGSIFLAEKRLRHDN